MKRRKSENPWLNAFGWYGALAALAAYLLVSQGTVGPHSLAYQLLNLSAAAGLGLEAWSKKDWQPAALNVVWGLIAIVAVIGLIS